MDNDSLNEKTMEDVHTKEIDLVNRDPKRVNDDVVKVSQTWSAWTFELYIELKLAAVVSFKWTMKPSTSPEYLLHSLYFTCAPWSRLTINVNLNKLWNLCRTAGAVRVALCADVRTASPFAHCYCTAVSSSVPPQRLSPIREEALQRYWSSLSRDTGKPSTRVNICASAQVVDLKTWTSSLQQRKHYEFPVVGTHISHSPYCARLAVGKAAFFPWESSLTAQIGSVYFVSRSRQRERGCSSRGVARWEPPDASAW